MNRLKEYEDILIVPLFMIIVGAGLFFLTKNIEIKDNLDKFMVPACYAASFLLIITGLFYLFCFRGKIARNIRIARAIAKNREKAKEEEKAKRSTAAASVRALKATVSAVTPLVVVSGLFFMLGYFNNWIRLSIGLVAFAGIYYIIKLFMFTYRKK
ncbi:MAG: hypothetical protein LBT49_01940 [Prevotellaceae bacterium]|jgi:hypothetical protein|nr:hypothetical protein [Prevotellaceae bacterium]